MTCDEFLDDFKGRQERACNRISKALATTSDAHFNRQPAPGVWSVGQILDHICIGNARYLPLMKAALDHAKAGSEELRHSLLGGFIIRALNSGTAPAPRAMTPREGNVERQILDKFLEQERHFISLADKVKGKRISSVGVWNPIIRIVRMNLADCFAIIAAHNDYHVPQIEERAAG